MAAPFIGSLLGWRAEPWEKHNKLVPNIADASHTASMDHALGVFDQLNVSRPDSGGPIGPEKQASGMALEAAVEQDLTTALPQLEPGVGWIVNRGGRIHSFRQYSHLAELERELAQNPTLRSIFSGDYATHPDVTVGIDDDLPQPRLHANVSCKFTLRSDRAQNSRQEALVMIRNRRGRSPHIVVVTVEPELARLASIARGMGDVDAVYHVALPELRNAVRSCAYQEQQRIFDELVGQGRLLDYNDLPQTLASH